MAFLDNQNPPIVSANVAALRNVATVGLGADAVAFVEAQGATAVMRFNPQDGAVENLEEGIVLPNDRTVEGPGRWRFERWA